MPQNNTANPILDLVVAHYNRTTFDAAALRSFDTSLQSAERAVERTYTGAVRGTPAERKPLLHLFTQHKGCIISLGDTSLCSNKELVNLGLAPLGSTYTGLTSSKMEDLLQSPYNGHLLGAALAYDILPLTGKFLASTSLSKGVFFKQLSKAFEKFDESVKKINIVPDEQDLQAILPFTLQASSLPSASDIALAAMIGGAITQTIDTKEVFGGKTKFKPDYRFGAENNGAPMLSINALEQTARQIMLANTYMPENYPGDLQKSLFPFRLTTYRSPQGTSDGLLGFYSDLMASCRSVRQSIAETYAQGYEPENSQGMQAVAAFAQRYGMEA